MTLTDDKVINILRTALLMLLYEHNAERMDEAGAVGYVHSLETPEGKKSFIIKFELESGFCSNWGILETKSDEFRDGSVIYYHETDADVVTYAALHGDGVINAEEHPNV